MQNPRNDGTCLAITIRSGKLLPEQHLLVQTHMEDVASDNEMQLGDGDANNIPVESDK